VQPDLDGPLIDSASKGIAVALVGTETGRRPAGLQVGAHLEGQGACRNVWIDAKSFLEVKMDGTPRRLDGKMHPVWVYFRDYKTVSGLVMPMVYETSVEGVKSTEKINIEKRPWSIRKLPGARFAKTRLTE